MLLRKFSCSSYDGQVEEKRETAPIRGPETLRAIAHPLRLRLYEALTIGGPATAAHLARDVPAAPGSLSYHLRQLTQHGFVEEAPELATDGRERVWRAVAGGAHWEEEDLEASEGLREVATSAYLMNLARQHKRLATWVRHDTVRFGKPWRSAALSVDVLLHLDAEELSTLRAELEEVVDRWITRSREHRQNTRSNTRRDSSTVRPEERGAPEAEDGREAVTVLMHAFPFAFREESRRAPEPEAGTES